MSEFVYLFRATPAASTAAMGTPEAAQRSMQAWMAWMASLESGGHLKERGRPLEPGGGTVRGSAAGITTDGPFAESKDIVMGFVIIEAKDLAEAQELAKGCPIVTGGGGSVEVRPVRTLPQPN